MGKFRLPLREVALDVTRQNVAIVLFSERELGYAGCLGPLFAVDCLKGWGGESCSDLLFCQVTRAGDRMQPEDRQIVNRSTVI